MMLATGLSSTAVIVKVAVAELDVEELAVTV
jgi:hypothetical protein